MKKTWLHHYDDFVPANIDYPRVPLYSILDETAARQPERPCTQFFGARLTYQEIKELSDRLAVGVRRLGVQPGDRVALLLPNSPQFIVAYFRENLTPYKVPSEVEFRADLPKSMIGKILRRALREEEVARGGSPASGN